MKKKYKLLLPQKIGIPKRYIEELEKICFVEFYNSLYSKNTKNKLSTAEILVTSFEKIDEKILRICPVVKCVITTTVGTDLVDLVAAKKYNIAVLNCPTHNSDAVASLVISFIFGLSRKILEANQSLRQGVWKPMLFKGFELENKILGLIGNGRISKKVAVIAKNLGMRVNVINSKSNKSDLNKLLSKSDFVSIHVPLSDKTFEMIDASYLKMMRKTSYLINTSRGKIIDQKALYKSLKNKNIAGAALDVFSDETFDKKSRKDIISLSMLPNVITTPHFGFNTQETFEKMGDELILNIKSFISGKPTNLV